MEMPIQQHVFVINKKLGSQIERRTMSANDVCRIDTAPTKTMLLPEICSRQGAMPEVLNVLHSTEKDDSGVFFEVDFETMLTPLMKQTEERKFRGRYNFQTGLIIQRELLRACHKDLDVP